MAFNEKEKQIIFEGINSQKKPDEIKRALARYRLDIAQPSPEIKKDTSFISDIKADMAETGSNLFNTAIEGTKETVEEAKGLFSLNQVDRSRAKLRTGGKIAETFSNLVGNALGGLGRAFASPEQEETAKQKFQEFLTKDIIPGTTEASVADISQGIDTQISRLPDELEKDVRAGSEIVGAVGLGGAGGVALGGLKKGLKSAASTGKELNVEIPKVDVSLPAFSQFRGGLDTFAQNRIKKEVDDLLNTNASLAKKTNEASKRGIDFNSIMSEPIVFNGLKVDNGKIIPDEAISTIQLRLDSLMDAKQAILPEVDRLVPAVSRETIRQRAIDDITGQASPLDEASIIAQINKQVDALPEEMTVSEIDKLRAQFRKSGRDAKGNQKESNQFAALENATRNTVFDITDDLPLSNASDYKELNDYIRQMVATKEFLDQDLRAKTVKGGRLGRYFNQMVGAAAGSQGGVIGTVVGAELGGLISDIITNNALGSSVKMSLIKNLTDDPEAIRQAQKLVGDIQQEQMQLLSAPSPDTPRTQRVNNTPIEMQRETQSSVDSRELENNQINNIPESKEVKKLDSLNPTGGLFVDYDPKSRVDVGLAENMTTLDKTMGVAPDTLIKIYRGAPSNQSEIVPGDFVTTNKELAKSYTGSGNVLELQVKAKDVLDDSNGPLGDEYIYRPAPLNRKEQEYLDELRDLIDDYGEDEAIDVMIDDVFSRGDEDVVDVDLLREMAEQIIRADN